MYGQEMSNRFAQQGITLVELIITIVIVGILSSIAYPGFNKYLQQSRRSEAHDALIQIANLQELFFLQKQRYASLSELGLKTFPDNSHTTENNYYLITATVASASYRLTATAIGTQTHDTECQTFTLAQDGSRDSSSHERCW